MLSGLTSVTRRGTIRLSYARAVFGAKTPQDSELVRILGSEVAGDPTKAELKELARCESAVVEAIGDEKALVLLADPGIGVTVVSEDAVTSVAKTGPKLRLTYGEILETTILVADSGKVSVSIETYTSRNDFDVGDTARLTHMIQAGVPSLEIAQRVCSTIDPRLGRGPKKKKRS